MCQGSGIISSMTDSVTAICAVVPAHNEELLIGRCLESLTVAARHARTAYRTVRVRVVVVADACTDDTARIAASFPGIDVLSLHARTVGAARAEGVDFALAAFRHDPEFDPASHAGWIGSTDADSVVPRNWFTTQIDLAEAGHDVMIGTVRPDYGDLSSDQVAAWTARHRPGNPNGHVHGANLGVRASSYLKVGGFLPLVQHEDVDLVGRLKQDGARLVASEACEVLTSGRQIGKTPGGYARYLAEDLTGDDTAVA